MKRVTEKELEAIVARINAIFGKKGEYGEDGAYMLSHAYGGVALHKYVGNGGGVSDVFRSGHMTKRELRDRMWSFIDGIYAKDQL